MLHRDCPGDQESSISEGTAREHLGDTATEVAGTTSTQLPMVAGVEVNQDQQGRYNLNALHKASGLGNSKIPSRWLVNDSTKELIAELSQSTNSGFGVVEVIRGGSSPGVYAHQSLAVSYAGWISPKFQLSVNQAFIDLKIYSQPQLPQRMSEALRLAADQAEQIERLQVSEDALHRIAATSGNLTVTDAAKNLQIKPKIFFDWLSKKNWTYKRLGARNWTAYQLKLDQGLLAHKVNVIEHTHGSQILVQQVLVTPKGLAKLAKELGKRHE